MKNLGSGLGGQKHIKIDEINRRHFMQKMVGLFGVTTASAVLSGCSMSVAKQFTQKQSASNINGKLFSDHQMTILHSVCDTILPRTDTPSATELDCHNFVQHQLQHCHTQQQQNNTIQIINTIEQQANKAFARSFPLLSSQQQQQLLIELERKELEVIKNTNKGGNAPYQFLKALIVFGYFTTEVGATQALNYQAIPGGFIGSIPANSETKSWGSLSFY